MHFGAKTLQTNYFLLWYRPPRPTDLPLPSGGRVRELLVHQMVLLRLCTGNFSVPSPRHWCFTRWGILSPVSSSNSRSYDTNLRLLWKCFKGPYCKISIDASMRIYVYTTNEISVWPVHGRRWAWTEVRLGDSQGLYREWLHSWNVPLKWNVNLWQGSPWHESWPSQDIWR